MWLHGVTQLLLWILLDFARFDLLLVLQVHISHIGEMRFKGVQEPQSVVQFCTAHLAARHFPQQPPSAKAELVKALT